MPLSSILTLAYLFIGFVLSQYWLDNDYREEHEKAVKEGTEDKGMTNIFLLFLMFFWPLKIVWNVIKKKKI